MKHWLAVTGLCLLVAGCAARVIPISVTDDHVTMHWSVITHNKADAQQAADAHCAASKRNALLVHETTGGHGELRYSSYKCVPMDSKDTDKPIKKSK